MSTTPPVRDATAARYTSLEECYQVIGQGISVGDDPDRDARLLQCIIAAESTLDLHMGRSMPDTDDADGPQPPTLIVPSAWIATATSVAIGIYQSMSAPFGTAGSDDWLGTISVPQIVAETVRRNPVMLGWQISFGVA